MSSQLNFRGTDLDPKAKGWATVESKEGRTDIKARFERLGEPTSVGPAYLTYVLWAVTPEGRAANLGEVVPGSNGKAGLHVTTPLQSFGLIVTAEPYAQVRQPSDAVMLENQILPSTVGVIQPIEAKYELLPRIGYSKSAGSEGGQGVSKARYEEIVQVYQARNAVQIAQSVGAAQLAPETFAEAQQLLNNAQEMLDHKGDRGKIIATARQAAQTAQDARDLASRRSQDAMVAAAVADAARERQRRMQAEAAAAAAVAESEADRSMLAQERQRAQQQSQSAQPAAASEQVAAERQAGAAEREQAAASQQQSSFRQPGAPAQQPDDARFTIYRLISEYIDVNDTPAGLMVTLPEQDFNGNDIQDVAKLPLAQIASVLRDYPGVIADVSERGRPVDNSPRALAVRTMLLADGAPANSVIAQTTSSNPAAAASGPATVQQQGVDIVLRGGPIGRQ